MPEMRLPLAIFTNAHRDAPLLAQLKKALRPRPLLHVDAALLRLVREPALGISHAAGDNWLVFAAERAIAAGAKKASQVGYKPCDKVLPGWKGTWRP